MKKIATYVAILGCISLLLLPVTSLAATKYDEYDFQVSFNKQYTSIAKEYLYADLGINWEWDCANETAYAEVVPQHQGLFWIWYSGTSTKCKANLDGVMCKRWVGANEGGLWRFVFTPYDNDGKTISGYTRLLSEE